MEMLQEKFCAKIRLLRLQKGWTQENVAELLNMSHAGYAKIERGESETGLNRVEEIAKIFGVQPAELLNIGETQNFITQHNSNNDFATAINNHCTFHFAEDRAKLNEVIETVKRLQEKVNQLSGK